MRWIYKIIAVLSTALALLGVLLPGLPTVPFLLLAAWAAGKGWPSFEQWLLRHPKLGPPIIEWRMHGRVSRKAKYLAVSTMALSLLLLWHSSAPLILQWLVTATLMVTATWLWRRPE